MKLAVVLLLGLVWSGANACGCSKPTTASDPNVLANADIIFRGEVVSQSSVIRDDITFHVVEFKVLELLKGTRASTVTVLMQDGGTSCDLERVDFQVGHKYLMSGFTIRESQSGSSQALRADYYNNFCCLRQSIEVATTVDDGQ